MAQRLIANNSAANARRRSESSAIRRLAAALERNQGPRPHAAAPPPPYSIKQFTACNPAKYSGEEGATALLQWFENMENTFMISECPEHLRVRFASSILTKRALTWWNGQKILLGLEAAFATSWDDFKTLMLDEFCPENELTKLEEEFNGLKQVSGNHTAYTTRFHELSLLVPHQVTPVTRAIKKYIRGLPIEVQQHVFATQPTTLAAAIRMAASITDNFVAVGTLTVSNPKKRTKETPKETKPEETKPKTFKKKKNNTVTYAINEPKPNITYKVATQPPPPQPQPNAPPTQKRAYTGTHPLCNNCHFHHPTTTPCRLCTICNRLGHFANRCRFNPNAINTPPAAIAPAPPRGCYECGDTNHFRNACPRLQTANAQPGRGRAFVITAAQAQANPNVVNGDV